jgi:DNA-binding CsgD family transcriptional regulator
VVCSLASQHWRAVPDWFEASTNEGESGDYPTIVEETVGTVFGPRITPWETQVVAQVLEGHSSESIAKSLGISAGTVRIHRRNIYAKLAISSQQELFSIFFQKIRTVQA